MIASFLTPGRRILGSTLVLFLVVLCVRVAGQNRLPPLAPDKLSVEQKKELDVFKAVRKGYGQNIGDNVTGPFLTLMRSPKLMNRVRGVGDYVRWEATVPPKINEFIAIITAREWTQPFVWSAHYNTALEEGLKPEIGQAVLNGTRPRQMSDEEEIAYEFTMELHRHHAVSDATYARALARFGEQGVVDMIGITGYYTVLSMVQNTARVNAPDNSTAPRLTSFPGIGAK